MKETIGMQIAKGYTRLAELEERQANGEDLIEEIWAAKMAIQNLQLYLLFRGEKGKEI